MKDNDIEDINQVDENFFKLTYKNTASAMFSGGQLGLLAGLLLSPSVMFTIMVASVPIGIAFPVALFPMIAAAILSPFVIITPQLL